LNPAILREVYISDYDRQRGIYILSKEQHSQSRFTTISDIPVSHKELTKVHDIVEDLVDD
jgi:hypothetical protein